MSDTGYDGGGNSGGSSSPSTPASTGGSPATSTPSPGTSPGTDTGGAAESGGFDFESIFSGPSESDVSPTDFGLTKAPPAGRPAAPPAAPSVPPQLPLPQQAPAQAPIQQPQAHQADPGVPQDLDRYDPGQLAAALTANEPQLTEILASQVLALSPQEVEALETNVVEALPRLMARTLLQAQKSTLTQMARLMPVVIQRHTEVMQRAGSDEGNFWRAWPQLNPTQHRQLVWSYGSMFRRMYPQATLHDIITHVGPMVMGATKTPMQQQQPQGNRQRGGNGRSPPPSPFVPAGSMGPTPGSSQRELSPWEAMFADQG